MQRAGKSIWGTATAEVLVFKFLCNSSSFAKGTFSVPPHAFATSGTSSPAIHTVFKCFGRAVNLVPSRHVIMPFSLKSQSLITELLITIQPVFSFSCPLASLGYLQSRKIHGHLLIRKTYCWNCIFPSLSSMFSCTSLGFFKFKVLQVSSDKQGYANLTATCYQECQSRSFISHHI